MSTRIKPKPNQIGMLLVIIVIIGSIVGIIYYFGETDQNMPASPQDTTGQTEQTVEEERARVLSALKDFLSSPPPTDPTLNEFYNALNSTTPSIVLLWPSSCSSCSSYKLSVWDSVKKKFNNATFIDFDLDSTEGSKIASRFNISGITIIFAYKGTIYGLSYGDHIPSEYLEYMVRLLTIHVQGGGESA